MHRLSLLRDHPVSVMFALAMAFVVWLWRDTGRVPGPIAAASRSVGEPIESPRVIPPSAPPERPTPREVARLLPKLKIGMTRWEVEGVLGIVLPEQLVEPATGSTTRGTYGINYEAEFEPAIRVFVMLEFDSTKPDNQLKGIRYPQANSGSGQNMSAR